MQLNTENLGDTLGRKRKMYHLRTTDEFKIENQSTGKPALTPRLPSPQRPCDPTSEESCGLRVRGAAAGDLDTRAQPGTPCQEAAWSL